MAKKKPLNELLTVEFFDDMFNKGITNQHEIATEVRRINGGTCSQSTINKYMKFHGLAPDKPTGRMKTGIDVKKVEQVYNLLEPYEIEPVPLYEYPKIEEIADMILLVSDLQIGAMDTDDGFDPVPEDTMNTYITNLLNNLGEELYTGNFDVQNFHLFLLGDIVDGELVYPAQQTINMSQQLRLAVKVVLRIIEFLKHHAGAVYVHSVAGNHGRVSFRNHKMSNWDNVIFDMIDVIYEKDNSVYVDLINHDFVKISNVGDWNFLYTHGHLIRGMYTREKLKSQTQDWYFSIGEFDASLFGHWHTSAYMDINGKPVVVNGCAYKSEYIRKQIGGVETLGMTLIKVGESKPIEWVRIIDVEE